MIGKIMLTSFVVALFFVIQTSCENVPATKVFILPIEPSMFNWTVKLGDDFSYRASLLNAPDLPKWIEYLYSKRHKTGFLYGVPPRDQKELEIEIIGVNKRTYETRRRVVHLNIEDKLEPATYQVHMKIDNLNVDDFFDLYRMSQLLNIFKYKLWKDSFFDLYFTFLTSAVSMGARLPLRPTEGEGVVVRLGSVAEFSNTLIELQEEVKPLWKLHSCPRDFKRTSVERIFRDEGFVLDWCNFRLIHESPDASKPLGNLYEAPMEPELFREPLWSRPTKAEVSRRSYTGEFAFTILVPTLIMILLVVLLSVILGFQHEGMFHERVSHSYYYGYIQRFQHPLVEGHIWLHRAPNYLVNIIGDYVQDRDEATKLMQVSSCILEGFILGLLLWNIAYDTKLQTAIPSGVSLTCFADDTWLLVIGSKRKSMTSEISASQFMGNPSRASSAMYAFSPELNCTSRSRTSSPQTASRNIVTNGIIRPTPPPYTGTMRSTVVDF